MVPAACFPYRFKTRSHLREKQSACSFRSSVIHLSPSGNAWYLIDGHFDGEALGRQGQGAEIFSTLLARTLENRIHGPKRGV